LTHLLDGGLIVVDGVGALSPIVESAVGQDGAAAAVLVGLRAFKVEQDTRLAVRGVEVLATVSQKVAHAIVFAARGTAVGTGEVGVHVMDVERAQEAELWSFQHNHIVEEVRAQVQEGKLPIVIQGGAVQLAVSCHHGEVGARAMHCVKEQELVQEPGELRLRLRVMAHRAQASPSITHAMGLAVHVTVS